MQNIPVLSKKEKVELTFRPIEKKDNPQVANIIRTVMTEFECVGEGYSINDPEIDDMYAAYNNDRSAFYVIEEGAIILGCGGIAPLEGANGQICELRKMYFFPALRGKGWGRKMVERCLVVAKKLGYDRCYLETVERMEQANFLYKKMGFEKSCEPLGNTGHSSCESYYIKEL
ncbi:MAG: GNAT family N-acetyltransferase [Bacteroidota bacterium]